jgi:hypothetical protein
MKLCHRLESASLEGNQAQKMVKQEFKRVRGSFNQLAYFTEQP